MQDDDKGVASDEDEPSSGISIAKAVSEPLKPVLRAALTPAAEVLGKALKERVTRWLEAKESENLREHVEAVLQELSATEDGDSSPSIEVDEFHQLELFQSWSEGARKVPPGNSEIAALWRAMLREIVRGEDVEARLVETLKRISASESRMLLYISRPEPRSRRRSFRFPLPRGPYLLDDLEVLLVEGLRREGLVETDWAAALLSRLPNALFALMMASVLTVYSLVQPGGSLNDLLGQPTSVFQELPALAVSALLAFSMLELLASLLKLSLFKRVPVKATWLGHRLASRVSTAVRLKLRDKMDAERFERSKGREGPDQDNPAG